MTVLYRKTRYLFSTYFYKITLERNVAIVESLCFPVFKKDRCFEMRQYSRRISSQKNDFEQEVYNPSKKISKDVYQDKYDQAFRGNLKIKMNGEVVETPTLVADIIAPRIKTGKN